MIIKFNDELTKQEIYANGDELARIMGQDKDEKGKRTYTHAKEKKEHIITFENPILMTDNHKISQLEPAKRDTLFALYGSHTKITEYDGVSLEFEQRKYLGVWGPSIDTMLFCKALKNEDLTNVKTAVEVGFGSGFISKYLLSKAPNLEEMTMIDLNPNTRECAETNIDDKRAKILIGDAQKLLKGKKYDLIVCNPPYIPRPKSIDDNAYEGVGLLHYLIKNAKELLTEKGTLITNISNLCEDIALQTIEESKANMNKLTSLEVPLKVYNVLNNPEWMKYLLEEKGLKQERKNGYDYWQAIEIMKIKTTKEKKKKLNNLEYISTKERDAYIESVKHELNKKDHSGNYFAASIGLVMISGILMFFNPLISMSAAITGISTALLGDRKSTLISKKNEKQMEKTKKELNKLYK